MRFAVLVMLASGCGKQLNADFCLAHPLDERCSTSTDAMGADTRNIDGSTATANKMYVTTGTGELYALDATTMDAQLIGVTDDPDQPGTPLIVDGLGFYTDGTLIGITDQSFLVRIDPATAQVTSKHATSAGHDYWGLTVAPPGTVGPNAAVLLAASDTGKLHEVSLDGTVRDIGSFGGGLIVAGDISWVPAVGLFASVSGSGCNGTCIARLSTTTGQATLLATSGPNDMWALAALEGTLWALAGSEQAYKVNQTSGVPTATFATGIAGINDAAP